MVMAIWFVIIAVLFVFRQKIGYFIGKYVVGPFIFGICELKAGWQIGREMKELGITDPKECFSRLKYEGSWQERAYELSQTYYQEYLNK